jgi:hypothetical protein
MIKIKKSDDLNHDLNLDLNQVDLNLRTLVTAHEKIQHLYFVEGGTKLSGQFLKEATV